MNSTDPYELMRAIRDANYHRGGLRCLRLLQLDPVFFHSLIDDVTRLCATQQASDVGDPKHVTHWVRPSGQVLQYSLLNATGRYDDFTTDHNLSIFGKRFFGADQYPLLGELIAAFPHAVNFRVNLLGPGARLAPHEEHSVVRTNSGSIGLRLRFHLPLITNPGSELLLEGAAYHLEAGYVYFINHGCFHAARNLGDQSRLHLVWDLLLTRESYQLLFSADSSLPFPARRFPLVEQHPDPIRQERLGSVRRIPSAVPEQEAQHLVFFEPQ